MLASTKALDALKNIGLNLYERKLWVALLAKGTAAAGELSQMSSVPRSRTYDILESLTEKGFVLTQVGKPVKFVAIKPDDALERVKKKMVVDADEMTKRIDDLKKSAVARELGDLFGKGVKTVEPEDFNGTLKGKQSLKSQLAIMFKGATKKIQIVTNADGLKDLSENHFDQLKKAKARGVDVKVAAFGNEGIKEQTKSLEDVANIKVLDSGYPVKGNFYVVDGKELVFALTEPGKVHETQHVAMWSRSEHVAGDVLEPLFKMVWESSK